MPEPELSTIKKLAAEVVAVTVKVGAEARSAGPLALSTVKLLPLPTTTPADDAGHDAVGVVQDTWGVAAILLKVEPEAEQVQTREKQGKLTELVVPAA